MSPRSFFSRLLSTRHDPSNLTNRHKDGTFQHRKRWHYIVQFFIVLALILSAVWLLMAIWYQFGAQSPIAVLATTVITGLLTALLIVRYFPKLFNRQCFKDKHSMNKTIETKIAKEANLKDNARNINAATGLTGLYVSVWLMGAGWFMSITPQQHRDWKPEVSHVLSYQRDANKADLITLSHGRNFDWHTGDDATERWETRTVDLSKLSGVDVINSYWMGPLIAHTLVSFRFEEDRPLAFSLEIRKENGESFSALGGFFKRYELSLIAAEERDIIYTRSNARGEQVYLFPVSHLQQREVRSLFESYLKVADELNAEPAWYNTLTSNCTNIIFYMARIVSGERLPWDYRIWVSGWLPNYLYDLGMLDSKPEQSGQPWSMDTWYERAHINPKVTGFHQQSNLPNDNDTIISENISENKLDAATNKDKLSEFSIQIRQGIPIPPLADSHAIRVNPN